MTTKLHSCTSCVSVLRPGDLKSPLEEDPAVYKICDAMHEGMKQTPETTYTLTSRLFRDCNSGTYYSEAQQRQVLERVHGLFGTTVCSPIEVKSIPQDYHKGKRQVEQEVSWEILNPHYEEAKIFKQIEFSKYLIAAKLRREGEIEKITTRLRSEIKSLEDSISELEKEAKQISTEISKEHRKIEEASKQLS